MTELSHLGELVCPRANFVTPGKWQRMA